MPIYHNGQPYVPVIKVTDDNFQPRNDYELETNSKSTTGAINEVNAKTNANSQAIDTNEQAIANLENVKATKTSVNALETALESESQARQTAEANILDSVEELDAIKLDKKPDGANFLLENNKITKTYVPDFMLGQLVYGGNFNANINSATLSANAKAKLGVNADSLELTNDNTTNKGYCSNDGIYYLVSVAGSFANLELFVGDWLISTGNAWTKIDNTDAVTGVKGNAEVFYRIGNVNITKEDIGLNNVDNTSDLEKPISTATQTALNQKANAGDVPTKTSDLTNEDFISYKNTQSLNNEQKAQAKTNIGVKKYYRHTVNIQLTGIEQATSCTFTFYSSKSGNLNTVNLLYNEFYGSRNACTLNGGGLGWVSAIFVSLREENSLSSVFDVYYSTATFEVKMSNILSINDDVKEL